MEEWFLNDLLECSVCLESMDNSSKVLPCQHTFCKKCLDDIVSSHKELRCPECRILVESSVEELPPNILLMRILEGMKSKKGKLKGVKCDENIEFPRLTKKTESRSVNEEQGSKSINNPFSTCGTNHQSIVLTDRVKQIKPTTSQQTKPCAIALKDYDGGKFGDLKFQKGDLIYLKKKIDINWYHGEINGNQGYFLASHLQIIVPLPSLVPQCKTLYDFQMSSDEEKDCLTFQKGEIITVMRRVDDHWAEGKLGDKIGIFPLNFVELNSVAKNLMKVSSYKSQSSRVVPPAPVLNSRSSSINTVTSNSVTGSQNQSSSAMKTISPGITGFDISGSESSISTPDSTPTSSESSSSSTTPSLPSSPTSNNIDNTQRPNNHKTNLKVTRRHLHKEKRHSFSSSNSGKLNKCHSQRHSMEVSSFQTENLPDQNFSRDKPKENKPGEFSNPVAASSPNYSQSSESKRNPENNSTISNNSVERNSVTHEIVQPSKETAISGDTKKQISSDPITSIINSNGQAIESRSHVPVPTIYLAMFSYKPQKYDELELKKGDLYIVKEKCQDGWYKGTSLKSGRSGVFPGNYVQLAKSSVLPVSQLLPSVAQIRSCNLHSVKQEGSNSKPQLPPRCSNVPGDLSTLQGQSSREMSSSSPSGMNFHRKDKEKTSVSFMKLLTGKRKSKSPPPQVYSMDNPVFEDPILTPVHVRSGSCPSQLIESQLLDQKKESNPSNSSTVKIRSRSATPKFGSHRSKVKSRPNIIVSNITAVSQSLDSFKNQSLNSSEIKQIAPLYREKFRCIVPYPPQSESELELNVGDIVFVHKKRDDGWFRGTLQKSGKTGLFPGSFVENLQ